ncbi:MAG TPA: cupredoxin domain-containing protein [Coriobacteriia bacterium]|jgi:plastocyanin
MHRTRRILASAVLLGTMFALAACTGASAPSGGGTGGVKSGGNTITLQNIAFSPTSLTVKSGDSVTFKNADQVPHHIVVGTDDLGEQQPGESKTWKAPKDGNYIMKCLIHPSMQGQITVGAGGSTVGTAPTGGGPSGGY